MDAYAGLAVTPVHEKTIKASPRLGGVILTQIVAFFFMYRLGVTRSLYDRVCERDGQGVNFSTDFTRPTITVHTYESTTSTESGRYSELNRRTTTYTYRHTRTTASRSRRESSYSFESSTRPQSPVPPADDDDAQ